MKVKKILSLVIIMVVISLAFASCKSRDACPGMSQVAPSHQIFV